LLKQPVHHVLGIDIVLRDQRQQAIVVAVTASGEHAYDPPVSAGEAVGYIAGRIAAIVGYVLLGIGERHSVVLEYGLHVTGLRIGVATRCGRLGHLIEMLGGCDIVRTIGRILLVAPGRFILIRSYIGHAAIRLRLRLSTLGDFLAGLGDGFSCIGLAMREIASTALFELRGQLLAGSRMVR